MLGKSTLPEKFFIKMENPSCQPSKGLPEAPDSYGENPCRKSKKKQVPGITWHLASMKKIIQKDLIQRDLTVIHCGTVFFLLTCTNQKQQCYQNIIKSKANFMIP